MSSSLLACFKRVASSRSTTSMVTIVRPSSSSLPSQCTEVVPFRRYHTQHRQQTLKHNMQSQQQQQQQLQQQPSRNCTALALRVASPLSMRFPYSFPQQQQRQLTPQQQQYEQTARIKRLVAITKQQQQQQQPYRTLFTYHLSPIALRAFPVISKTSTFQKLTPQKQPERKFHIHEYQAAELFKSYGIPTPRGAVASTPEEAEKIAHELGGKDFVVKAQVLAGGRGKGTFQNGFVGGVHTCTSPKACNDIASKMLGQKLFTKQTGDEGRPVSKVYITERLFLRREAYLAILLDRAFAGPVIVASSKGGVDIEQVAHTNPELIVKEPIDIKKGPRKEQLEHIATAIGFDSPAQREQAVDIIGKFYKLFTERDCLMVEVNPIAETHEGKLICVDAKVNFDANAYFRQKDLYQLRDHTQVDQREVIAEEAGLNYIGLDGSIGCLVNGAGLAMSTMDIIKLHGGNPANFLDVGGGASEKQVAEAFKLLNSDSKVRAILVNIFGGIMRCDIIAMGIIKAATEVGLKKPLVVRLAGTNVKEAKELLELSGLRVIASDDLDDAAKKAVRIAEIVRMAESVDVNVSFELPV